MQETEARPLAGESPRGHTSTNEKHSLIYDSCGPIFLKTAVEGANLFAANLTFAILSEAHLEEAILDFAHLEMSLLLEAHLESASLYFTHLENAFLGLAHLESARTYGAYMESAEMSHTHFEGATLFSAHLEGAEMSGVYFDNSTQLNDIVLENKKHGAVKLIDIHWNDVNVTTVNWSLLSTLGDEQEAHQKRVGDGKIKSKGKRLSDYQRAVRANRQLAVVLKNQGIDEDAARFAYRGQVLQERVLWYQIIQPKVSLKSRVSSFFAWLYSCLLFLLSGYGYRIHRSFLTYIAVIGLFTVLYHFLVPGLAWQIALEVSLNACLSRGIPPSAFQAGDMASLVSDVEAFIGLVIEVVFIATLTQRFFNK